MSPLKFQWNQPVVSGLGNLSDSTSTRQTNTIFHFELLYNSLTIFFLLWGGAMGACPPIRTRGWGHRGSSLSAVEENRQTEMIKTSPPNILSKLGGIG